MKNKSPNFLLVGGAKCGSTSLYYLLNQHPDIFMPKFKEPLYFISDVIKKISKKDLAFKNEGLKDHFIHNEQDYLKLFENVRNETSIGEASATYMYYHKCSIPKIKNMLNDPKIIIILREPVEKSFSQYKHLLKLNAEKLSFEESLEQEDVRISENYTAMYHYKAQGSYFNQIKAFFENFSNVLVVFMDELRTDPISVSQKCYSFLDVDSSFKPKIKIYNKSSKKIKFRKLHNLLYSEQAFNLKMRIKPLLGSDFYKMISDKYRNENISKIDVKIAKDTRNKLKAYFKSDIEKIERYLDKDLSLWKN